MSGVRPEPVEVWLIDGRPARFVWRERLYTVLSILERPPAEPAGPHDGDDGQAAHHRGEERSWRCWKITASAGRNVPANIYRLCQDPSTSRWQLTRNGR